MNWPLKDQQDQLTQVVDEARRSGPQVITANGAETAVVLSIEEYRKLAAPQDTLVEFFQRSPLRGVDLNIERDQSWGRDVDL
jgi:antitoxin Phd